MRKRTANRMVEEAVLIAGWAITRRNGERFLENGDRFG